MMLPNGSSIMNQIRVQWMSYDGLVMSFGVLPPIPCMIDNMKWLMWDCMQAPHGPLSLCQHSGIPFEERHNNVVRI
jgi:hypothetical protein